ncbi:ATP-dependent RNA helicase DDX4, partial [Fragariocoptes setiger]
MSDWDWGSPSKKRGNSDSEDWGASKKSRSSDTDGDDWGGSKKSRSGDTDGDDWGGSKKSRSGDTDGDDWGGSKKSRSGDTDGDDWGGSKKPRTADPDRPAPYKPEEVSYEQEVNADIGENFNRYTKQEVKVIGDEIEPVENFSDIVTSKLLLERIREANYKQLTPIQKYSLPALTNGYDLVGCAETGSGKTAAFLIPVLQYLLKLPDLPSMVGDDCQNPFCLIIAPTRELARQIYVEALKLSRDSIVKPQYISGGISTPHLKYNLLKGTHILVSTPGRLKDFVEKKWIGFSNLRFIIMDEGDRLIDDGFLPDIRKIFENETMPPQENRQTIFFSATFSEDTQRTAREFIRKKFVFITVGRVGAANQDVKQEFMQVTRPEKKRRLKEILKTIPEDAKTIIFTQTKAMADTLAGFFTALNLSATSIHGDRHQSQRDEAISHFKKGLKRFLISSPVGNRGLDLPNVSLVINYDLPSSIDEYVHRIGRTGRIGHTGRAISFFDPDKDSEIAKDLVNQIENAAQEVPGWLKEIVSGAPPSSAEPTDNQEVDEWGVPSAQPAAQTADWATSTTADDDDWGC